MAIFNVDYLKENMIYAETENLDEQTIYKGKGKKSEYCIFSDMQEGRNFDKDPYIKVYNNTNQRKVTEVIRISMKDGRAITTHSNTNKDGGKKDMNYTKDLAEFLTKAMNEEPIYDRDFDESVKTVYDAIYFYIDRALGFKSMHYDIPNFMEAYKK